MPRLWNVAHRGASAELPENTLPAFEKAIADGADVVEADVRLTSDGQPLLMHDETVDRTTSGTGPLREMTAEQARTLDAGRGAFVPTIAELLELARDRARVNLDIKEPEALEPALEAVRWADMLESVTFISFLPEVWDRAREVSPHSPLVHLIGSAAGLAGIAMGDTGSHGVAAGVGIPHALANHEVIERLQRHGYGVFAWTVDDEDEMRRLIAAGINGIVTNRPAALAALTHELGVAIER